MTWPVMRIMTRHYRLIFTRQVAQNCFYDHYVSEKIMNLNDRNEKIKEVEHAFDQHFSDIKFPSDNLSQNLWIILSVIEDNLRLIFFDSIDAWHLPSKIEERGEFITRIDSSKYALRQLLLLLEKKKSKTAKKIIQRFSFEGNEYTDVAKLLHVASDTYAKIVRSFISNYTNLNPYKVSSNNYSLKIEYDIRKMQYGALEFLVERDTSRHSPFAILAALLVDDKFYNRETGSEKRSGKNLKKLIRSVKVRNGNVSYQFIAAQGKSLYKLFNYDLSIIPNNWIIFGCTGEELQKFFVGLHAICAYHLVSIYKGSLNNNLKGAGINNQLLVLEKKQILSRLTSITDIEHNKASLLFDHFTYGYKTQYPDLSLQPIIQLEGNLFSIPCLMTISNDHERNSLALQARIETKLFDNQSRYFESIMVENLKMNLNSKYTFFSSVKFMSMEIDAVIVDEESFSINIIELKWSLRPGDTSEIANRHHAINRGVSQLKLRFEKVNQEKDEFVRKLGLEIDCRWKLYGCVLTEGYLGHPSHDPSLFPVVPRQIYNNILDFCEDFQSAMDIMRSPVWLPRPDIDYTEVCETIILGKYSIQLYGFIPIGFSYEQKRLPKYVEEGRISAEADSTPGVW